MKKLLDLFWIMNIIAILTIVAPVFLAGLGFNLLKYFDEHFWVKLIYILLSLGSGVLWIYCFINAHKVSKNPIHTFMLFMFNAIYLIFYYYWFYIRNRNKKSNVV